MMADILDKNLIDNSSKQQILSYILTTSNSTAYLDRVEVYQNISKLFK